MLLLRKECEAVLAAYDLQELHVQRSDVQKCLSLVGSCGRELVTIYGINIPSRLKSGEREYALDLFVRFMDTNNKLITDGIKAKKAFIALKEPEPPKGFCIGYGGSLVHKNSGHTFNVKGFKEGVYSHVNTATIKVLSSYFTERDKYDSAKELADTKMNAIAKCTI